MKKVLFLFICFVLITYAFKISPNEKSKTVINENKEMRGVFVSYLELNTYIRDKEEKLAKNNIKKIVKNTKNNKLNTIILQVRAFDDAIYPSKYYPISKSIVLKDGKSFDVLAYFIKECKKNNIDIYIWINPFRITKLNEELSLEHDAYKYKDSSVVKKIDGIYYYNPARDECLNHVILGINELISKYKFKGILFDDYFYPNLDIDSDEYKEYIKNNKNISLEEFHLLTINNFIENVYKDIKEHNKNIEFGVSPDANMDNLYGKLGCDVKTWCSSDKYIDFIMPQVYYGFYNSSRPFVDTVYSWSEIIKNDNIKLYFALAFYKVGTLDNYAKDGAYEWVNNSDIIKKQIIIIRNVKHYDGFSLFRYDNLFNEDLFTDKTKEELNNLKNTLNN